MPMSAIDLKPFSKMFSPVALAVSLGCTLSAAAQQVDSEEMSPDDAKFEAITVTATKRPQVIYEVPMALSAFDGDKLAAQGITVEIITCSEDLDVLERPQRGRAWG